MKKTMYLECNAGISGDMSVAALLDLGADEKVLRAVLDSIPAQGFSIEISRVKKAGVDCCDFNVVLDHEHENHDHDMEYLHGHHHDHEHHHHHEHHHDHAHHHHHEHRGMKEITEILDATQMTDSARALAKKIFGILAESEAKAHATDIEHVHFHEVGAIDSIVDIVAVAVCVDNLGITDVVIPKLCEGSGTVRCQHGVLSIPVPATANIMAAYHFNVEIMNVQGEFITPTGAAIVAALMTSTQLPKHFSIDKIGLGAGKRTYERPSILRAMLITETAGEKESETGIVKLETNIDDCSGEILGYTLERLFAAGARDVNYMPVFMKKNRPGYQLNVICEENQIAELEQIIFEETTTIGIRRIRVERSVLEREIKTVQTPYGEAQVKVCKLGDKEKVYPEYESVVSICKETKLPYQEVFNAIKNTVN